MVQRDRGDGTPLTPEEDQRGTAEHGEDRRAHRRGDDQQHQSRRDQGPGRDRGKNSDEDDHHSEQHGYCHAALTVGGAPGETQRDRREAQGHDQLQDPFGYAVQQDIPEGDDAHDVSRARHTQQHSDGNGERVAVDQHRLSPASCEHDSERGERQQSSVARGQGAAEHSDDENHGLRDRVRPGNAGVEHLAKEGLRQRDEHHHREHEGDQQVLAVPQLSTPSRYVLRRPTLALDRNFCCWDALRPVVEKLLGRGSALEVVFRRLLGRLIRRRGAFGRH